MSVKGFGLERSRLSAALFAALVMPVAGVALAQDATPQDTTSDQTTTDQATTSATQKATNLDKVIVTGSLIPQTQLETYKPVTVISADDLQKRGFTSVADALQRSSFATGAAQGQQTSASFTQGAETISLFGLNPGYTKYLIDGRPMANYPALYNGSDVFNNISGIPSDLVERIEILPGGQSSLYGSDAIAGVINFILKKKVDGPILDVRLGGYSDGGGQNQRYSFSDSFGNADGRLNVLFGAEYEQADPIWGYDRDLTSQFNQNAYNGAAPIASRDFLVYSPFSSYHFLDPNNCAAVTSGFGGTEGLQTRPGFGDTHYCGSLYSPGYRTLKNGKDSGQIYTHATFDISDNTRLYADFLYNNESVRYHIGSNYTFWSTSLKWGYYYDPRIGNALSDAYCGGDPACPPGDLLNMQRAFMPEDMNGFEHSMDRNDSHSYAVTGGINGTFGESNWDYDASVSRTQYNLSEHSFARLNDPINNYFQTHYLGPQLGLDPYFGAYPVFEPNYAAFYNLISPEDFASFTGYTINRSKTYDNTARAQFTNGSLFSLPGGDAGVALVAEAGNEGWQYTPDPLLAAGGVWGTTSVGGSDASRSRYAVTGEMRLPVFDTLTISASGRYDSYKVDGNKVSKPTYSLGIEYRPIESLLFRGQYGTAFKAPTLADEFQGESGYFSFTTDYLNCNKAGFDPNNVQNCPARYSNLQFKGTQAGNPELKPITAKVWEYGVVWSPWTNENSGLTLSADYHHWNIENEVAGQSVDQLMRDELACTSVANGGTGALDPNSGTCLAAFAQITRGAAGNVTGIRTTKVNVASEILNVATADVKYRQGMGSWGDLQVAAQYNRNLSHHGHTYATDPIHDYLNDPYYSSDPKWKANGSVGWSIGPVTTTLYADVTGPTPNYRATTTTGGYSNSGAGRLGTYTTFNASVNYDVTSAFRVSFLVNNLTNKYPDMDHTYPTTTGAPYNIYNFNPFGRAYYLEARWSFGKKD